MLDETGRERACAGNSHPTEIERTIELEDYAVQTEYPGDYTPVDEIEYQKVCQIAVSAMNWVRTEIK